MQRASGSASDDGAPVRDDDLVRFEAEGPWPLPAADETGHVEGGGARVWYASWGRGAPVVLLHGGLGHAGNWGYQVPTLLRAGRRVIAIDTRGHGRSTWDGRPLRYADAADDVAAVLRALGLEQAHLVGWSDGAVTALLLALAHPERVAGVLFFACNVDPSGTKPFEFAPVVQRAFHRHQLDYARLSATPDRFDAFVEAVGLMQRTQPNLTAQDLATVQVPVTVVHAEHDEFIHAAHAAYLARTLPHGALVRLLGVSHFAPLQRPDVFDGAVAAFLAGSPG